MLIRPMQKEDIPEVGRIEKEIFSEPWSEESFLGSIHNDNNLYLVAEIDGVIAGYCGYWGIAGEGNIVNVAVKEIFRRKQIGYRLMTELLQKGEEKGMKAFTLEVRCSNLPAIQLYERLGFISAGIRKGFYVKPKEDAVIMWLRMIQ